MAYGKRGGGASKPRGDSGDDSEDWLLSYSDLLSLLFAFMAILLSVSTIDITKMDRLSSSISGTFSGEEHIAVLDKVRAEVKDALELSGYEAEAELRSTARGLEIDLSSTVLFKPASADLSEDASSVLEAVILPVLDMPVAIEVEGHTDAIPIHSRLYPSNWELSGARASEVVREIIGFGFEPQRLKAVGLADTRPPGKLEGEEPKDFLARQRRVTLILIPQASEVALAEAESVETPTED